MPERVEDLLDQSHNSISSSLSPIWSSQSTPDNQISNGNTEESDVQRAATKRMLLYIFNQAILLFVNRHLDDENWSTFEDLVNRLTTDLKDLMVTTPRRHTTTNWKHQNRRRQNSRPQTIVNNRNVGYDKACRCS